MKVLDWNTKIEKIRTNVKFHVKRAEMECSLISKESEPVTGPVSVPVSVPIELNEPNQPLSYLLLT